MNIKIQIKKLDPKAVVPKLNFESILIDLYALDLTHLHPKEKRKIRTGIAIAIPKGYLGHIIPKDVTRTDHCISSCSADIINHSTNEEVSVTLINNSNMQYFIDAGQKIAEMVILPAPEIEIELI